MLRLEEAKQLRRGDVLLNEQNKRWRVNGMVKTWKRDPNRIRVPLKHGLYAYDYIDEHCFDASGVCNWLTKEQ